MNHLHVNAQRVQELLDAAGVDSQVQGLSKETRTAAAAAEELGCEIGAIANSLVFLADGEPVLVMTSGAHRVDEDFLAGKLGATELSRANAAQVREATGQPIGGVAPIGHPRPLPTIVDPTLENYPTVWMGGGAPNSIFGLTFNQLMEITGGRICPVNGQ